MNQFVSKFWFPKITAFMPKKCSQIHTKSHVFSQIKTTIKHIFSTFFLTVKSFHLSLKSSSGSRSAIVFSLLLLAILATFWRFFSKILRSRHFTKILHRSSLSIPAQAAHQIKVVFVIELLFQLLLLLRNLQWPHTQSRKSAPKFKRDKCSICS